MRLSDVAGEKSGDPFRFRSGPRGPRVRADLERRGLGIGPLELLSAGKALDRNAILVASNIAEFRGIAGLRAPIERRLTGERRRTCSISR